MAESIGFNMRWTAQQLEAIDAAASEQEIARAEFIRRAALAAAGREDLAAAVGPAHRPKSVVENKVVKKTKKTVAQIVDHR